MTFDETVDAIEAMITRRMDNTNDTPEEARTHVINHLTKYAKERQAKWPLEAA